MVWGLGKWAINPQNIPSLHIAKVDLDIRQSWGSNILFGLDMNNSIYESVLEAREPCESATNILTVWQGVFFLTERDVPNHLRSFLCGGSPRYNRTVFFHGVDLGWPETACCWAHIWWDGMAKSSGRPARWSWICNPCLRGICTLTWDDAGIMLAKVQRIVDWSRSNGSSCSMLWMSMVDLPLETLGKTSENSS